MRYAASARFQILCARTSIGIAVVCACCIAAVVPTAAAQAEPRFEPCARDETYRLFERLQYEAYMSRPSLAGQIDAWRDLEAIERALEETGRALGGRPDPLKVGSRRADQETHEFILQSLRTQQLPTCYENPLIFYLVKHYADKIDAARQRLGLPLAERPRVGTMPTMDINAVTYQAGADRGAVIAFNTQLFMFAHQMTKVVLPTIAIRRSGDTNFVVDISSETALEAIENDSDLLVNFSMALLEFLDLTAPDTQPLDPATDLLVSEFTQGLELFAVAHEYAHVIENHAPPAAATRSGQRDRRGTDQSTMRAVSRSWDQELEADALAVRLVSEALRSDSVQNEADEMTWLFSLRGAAFFFKSLALVDRAKYVRDHDVLPPTPAFDEREFLRALASGTATEAQRKQFAHVRLGDHPPAWLRLERVRILVDQELAKARASRGARDLAEVGTGITENADLVWRAIAPKIRLSIKGTRILEEIEKRDPPPSEAELRAMAEKLKSEVPKVEAPVPLAEAGCGVVPERWVPTLLCNVALQGAVVALLDSDVPDATVLRRYAKALESDVLLMSGIQVRWAERVLDRGRPEHRRYALAVLGLSGDQHAVPTLESLSAESWPEPDRLALVRVKTFLQAHGRDTSVRKLVAGGFANASGPSLLMYPSGIEPLTNVLALVDREPPRGAVAFSARASGVEPARSLSSMALFMRLSKQHEAINASTWTSLLLQVGEVQAALDFVAAAVEKLGTHPSLELDYGNVLSKLGRRQEANGHYEASLSAGRSDGWPELNIAQNLAEDSDLPNAESWFRRALSRRDTARSSSEYARYLNEFAWFLVTKRRDDPAKVEEALKLSETSNTIVERKNANYLDTLAECHAAAGDLDRAIATAREALGLVSPGSSETDTYERRLRDFEARRQK